MAPKKVAAPEVKPLMGRVGTNLKVGIVGIPNVGKSTFFNVLTKSQASAENFLFCTIDPNESLVPVPNARYDYLCQYFKPLSAPIATEQKIRRRRRKKRKERMILHVSWLQPLFLFFKPIDFPCYSSQGTYGNYLLGS
ncbi:obg-like ATPase 1 [Artemia franciscana]|uniref:obg-like ATPase 1 n=1 Tax=Artemia franciscana TaxID=6661 RepID=UPI0032DA2B21